MQHLYFFYFLIIFVLGVSTFSVTILIYRTTKVQLLRNYLIFYSIWTLMVFFSTFAIYVQTNLTTPNPAMMIIVTTLRAISVYLLIVAVPAFMHYLCEVPDAAFRNKIFAGLSVLLFTGFHLFHYVIKQVSIQQSGPVIEGTIFMGTICYTIITTLLRSGQLQDTIKKKLARRYLWLLIIFFPGIFCDMYLGRFIPIRIVPLFYGVFSIVFMKYFISSFHHYPLKVSAEQSIEKKVTVSIDDFCLQYDITNREQEIITCLLQGYSNPQIASKLCISLSTVKTHLRNIYQKIGVTSRYELIVHFKDRSVLTPEIT